MSVTVYGTFYSAEAADKAAAAVEKTVRGARPSDMTQPSGGSGAPDLWPDAFFSFPAFSDGSLDAASPLPVHYDFSPGPDDTEPSQGRAVTLSVLASGDDAADAVVSVMHNSGGYDVHKSL